MGNRHQEVRDPQLKVYAIFDPDYDHQDGEMHLVVAKDQEDAVDVFADLNNYSYDQRVTVFSEATVQSLDDDFLEQMNINFFRLLSYQEQRLNKSLD